jgi:hypothetical protein
MVIVTLLNILGVLEPHWMQQLEKATKAVAKDKLTDT